MTLAPRAVIIFWPDFHNLYQFNKHSSKQLFVQAHEFAGWSAHGAQLNDKLGPIPGSSLWSFLCSGSSCVRARGLSLF